ncbi:phosphodiester glycosidase family protein [bacterium]|nr:phosphodiester glycosidase family protein [bacterium]
MARPACAAELREIVVSHSQYFLDIRLGFDSKPAYTEAFRFDPDRYLLTFTGCKLVVPEDVKTALAEIDHSLLTRISTYQSSDNLQLGFYLNLPVQPLIRFDQQNYYLRFYTSVRSEQTIQLATGVSLIEKTSAYRDSNFHLYMVKIDPGSQVRLYTAAADRYDGKTRRREASSFARREGADVVINGGFFGSAGEHLSTLVEDGIIRATGVYPTRPLMVVTTDGQVLIGRFNVETALIVNGSRIPVSAKNYPYEPGKVIVYDYKYPIENLPQNGMFYYLLENNQLRFYSYSTSGLWLAPEVMLIGTDIIPEANPLQQIPAGTSVQLETRITDMNGQVVQARSAVGGAPMLIENGAVNISSAEDKVRADIAKSERSRTAVALTRSGQLILAVVKELESAGFGGVTLEALSDLLLTEGAYTAMNLDGGGSSTIVVAGEVLNMAESEQRPVSNVLVLALDESGMLAGAQTSDAQAPAPSTAASKYNPQN